PTTLYGMDTMMNLLLLYLMIGPSGAALSVDRLVVRYWRTRRALREGRPIPANLPPAPRVSANLALRLMQVNLCIIYLVSGLSKLLGPAWWNGTAIWRTMAVYEFSPMYNETYMNFLRFLCAHRWLWELCTSGAVVYTLVTEIGYPFLVWNRRLRWLMLTMAIGLHTGIALFMSLRTFSLMMVALNGSFVPASVIHRLLSRFGLGVPKATAVTKGPANPGARS